MTLTNLNYFEVGNDVTSPMMSSSIIKYLRHGDGGSIENLNYYLENYDAIQEAKRYNFSLEYGTLLHKYMENPDNFVIADFTRPSETIVNIVTAIFENALAAAHGVYEHVGGLHDWGELIDVAVDNFEYQKNWKKETRVAKIIEQGELYFNFLRDKKDAHVLTDRENEVLNAVIDKWLVSPEYSLDNQIDWMREVPIEWEQVTMWGRIACKSLIDKLYVNHDAKTVVIEDIKTTHSITGFIHRLDTRMSKNNGEPENTYVPGPFISYRYYRQLAFYRRAVLWSLQQGGYNASEYNVECRILAFENKAPYQIKKFIAPDVWLAAGEAEIDEAFTELKMYYERYIPEF